MSCLVVVLGFAVGLFGLAAIIAVASGEAVGGFIFIEAVFVTLFCICLKKYKSPEYQEKMKKAREQAQKYREEWKAGAPEREQKRKEELERIRENERLRTTIVSTRLIGEGAAEYKKGVGNMLARGAVGGFFAGAAGAALGMATAKNKNTNKNVRRFLVKYLDGHIEEKEATIGSARYKEYMAHLEWENN